MLLAVFSSLADQDNDKPFFDMPDSDETGTIWTKNLQFTTESPGAADDATFKNPGSYTIDFEDRPAAVGDHVTVAQTDVYSSAQPTFNLHAAEYEVGALNIFGSDPSLTITNGKFINTGATRLGMQSNTEGSLILQVMGTEFEVDSDDDGDIYVGNGQVALQTGTTLTTNGSDVRVGITGSGEFIVDGGIVSAAGDGDSGDIIVGTGGWGYADFGGATTQVTSAFGVIGEDVWGQVAVHDGATWQQTLKMLVGVADAEKPEANPYGVLSVSTGGHVDSKLGALVEVGDVFIINESSTWDVEKGLVIRDAGFVDVSQQGHLNVKSGTSEGYLFVGSDPPPPDPDDPFPAPPEPSAPGDPVLSINAGGVVTVENDGSSTMPGNVVISERGTVEVTGAASTLRTEAVVVQHENAQLRVTDNGSVNTVNAAETIRVKAGTVTVNSAGEIQADGGLEVTETGTMIISGAAAAAGKVTSKSGLLDGAEARVEVRGDGSQWGLSFGTFGFELKEGTVELRDGGRLYDQFSNSEIAAPGKVLTLTGDGKLEWKRVTTKGDGAHIVPDGETDQIATLTFETDELDATLGMTYFADIEKVGGVTDNDVLNVTGAATLAGTLNVTALMDPMGFAAGDSFTVLDSGAPIAGTFDDVILPGLDSGLSWEVEYTDDVSLNVVVNQPEIAMDVDDDGYGGCAELYDDSSSVDFGTTDEGAPVTRTFTVENEGNADLTLDFASASVPTGFSLSGQSGAVTVSPGSSITFSVDLDASSPGYFSGNLTLSNNDSDENPFDVYLEGNVNALQPEIEMDVDEDGHGGPAELFDDSSSVDFGTTGEGTPVTRTFTVENEGGADLTLDFASASVPTGFSLSGQSGTVTVSPGNSITFSVDLHATSPGYFSGNLTLSNNDSDENPFDVYLEGNVNALEPEIEMDVDDDGYGGPAELYDDSSSVDFGTTDEGTAATRTFTVENEGNADLTLDFASASVPTGFSLSGQSGAVTVSPGNSITFNVDLDASSPGYFSGNLTLSNNDSDENPFDVYLEGNVNALEPEIEMDVDDDGYGGPAELYDDSSSVNFGTTDEGTPVTRTFTVENDGSGDLTLDFASASVPTGFSLSGQSGTVTVSPGSSVTFSVDLHAASPGYFSGNLSLSNNDSDEDPFDVFLEGNVNALEPEIAMDVDDDGSGGPADLYDDSSSVDFGTTDEGTPVTRTFTVENDGTGDLTLDFASASVPTGFSLSGQSGTVTVSPGNSITFNVALDASSPGYFSGNLTLSNNDTDENPFDVYLYGEVDALQPEIEMEHEYDDGYGGYSYYELYDGDSVYFDSTVTGAPITETFVVHNTGTNDLTLDLGGTILPAGFSLAASPATTVAAGGSTSFTVQLDATTAGTFSGNLELANNDSDENPFDVYLYGYVDTPEYLTLDMPAVSNSSVPGLTASQVTALANEAARRWLLAGADADELRSMLATVDIRITDLPGSRLGAAGDNEVLLDVDAAGYGWFIDSSPADDRDFQRFIGGNQWQAAANSDAAGRADLLTVVTHEFGHLLGLDDLPTAELPHHIMTDTIGLGTRRTVGWLPAPLAADNSREQPPLNLFEDVPVVWQSVHKPQQPLAGADRSPTVPVDSFAPSGVSAETDRFHRALDEVFAEGDLQWEPALDPAFRDDWKPDDIFRELGMFTG